MSEKIEDVKIDTDEFVKNYEVIAFSYGLCIVKRKSDDVRGTMRFDHAPRRYYRFTPEAKS